MKKAFFRKLFVEEHEENSIIRNPSEKQKSNVGMNENVKSYFQELNTWDIWIVSGDGFMEHTNIFSKFLLPFLQTAPFIHKTLDNQILKQIMGCRFSDI